ncbi:hypothetical protein ACWT_5300 [Actinoplanes sp. SE50]|uniref:HAAS signaling domain-containing protein n=1 Tax=unclassified Actinoplanes TaxID=2626549 RepID=UPI00023EBF8B|nr:MULTISPECIES: hypothetical protein [unclassified Actinoplanes]AEV86318.1 hypothetical protein ACPL_5431 [Actinoplanes sp. SE50/110]ATO84715.1 hypothetical protein ACWT_5300 [Actinoplanes sp. SE50]SLM02125.1 hypothetical protein ACSP50_5363 [Actinoplanes sp. SE50/110]
MNDTATDQIATYVAAVRLALGGVPETTREELLDDLPEHLAEVLAEDNGTLVERLGAPAAYAAELLATAGFVSLPPQPDPRWDNLRETRDLVLRGLRVADVRVGPALGHERASEFLLLLRPAWWVLRGYLVAMVLAVVLDHGSGPIGLLPRIGGSDVVALALLAGCVVASIWFGRRPLPDKPWARYALWSGTTLLVLMALAGFTGFDSDLRQTPFVESGYSGGGPADAIQDIFVYDSQGHPIQDAQLYDSSGAPIQLGNATCTDPRTGNSYTSWHRGYPHCPDADPFQSPSPDPTLDGDNPHEEVTPSATPPSAGPSASGTPSAAPSASPSR